MQAAGTLHYDGALGALLLHKANHVWGYQPDRCSNEGCMAPASALATHSFLEVGLTSGVVDAVLMQVVEG